MKEESPKNEEAVLEKLLEFLPEETETEVNLPSRGKFYTLKDKTKPVVVRPMTFEDEKVLASQTGNKLTATNLILGRCVDNVDLNDLLIMDKVYLLVKIREISYGKDFEVRITCPRCRDQADVKVDISKLETKYLPKGFENPRTVSLPVLKKKITVRFPRVRDEQYLSNASVALKQLWRFVDKVEDYTDKKTISAFLNTKNFPLSDMHVIVNAIHEPDYGLDTRFNYKCDCGTITLMDVPLGEDFFTMK